MANYAALDKPGIFFNQGVLCVFAWQTKDSYNAFKRPHENSLGGPYSFGYIHFQQPSSSLLTQVETDFAVRLSTRRPTSGGICMKRAHLVKQWNATQNTVTLSSGESELHGVCEVDSTLLGRCQSFQMLVLNGADRRYRCYNANRHHPPPRRGKVRHTWQWPIYVSETG